MPPKMLPAQNSAKRRAGKEDNVILENPSLEIAPAFTSETYEKDRNNSLRSLHDFLHLRYFPHRVVSEADSSSEGARPLYSLGEEEMAQACANMLDIFEEFPPTELFPQFYDDEGNAMDPVSKSYVADVVH